jgi:hypothetical protein
MMLEEKAELAGLLEERMRRRERWPKIEILPKEQCPDGILLIRITHPSSPTVEKRR